MAKKINKVSELAKDLGFEQKGIEEIDKEIEERSLSRILTILRVQNNITQGEIAKKLKVTQSYISKLESSSNERIGLKEVAAYVNALGYDFGINISKPKTIVQKIKDTYVYMRNLFKELNKTQREDEKIIRSQAKFEFEAATNMLNLVDELIENGGNKIRKRKKERTADITINDLPLESSEIQKNIEKAFR